MNFRRSFIRGAGAMLIGFASLLMLGCVNVSRVDYDDDRRAAVAQTENFHRLFSEQKFESIWELTDEQARKTKSKDALIGALTAQRNNRGRVMSSSPVQSNVEARGLYREVRVAFRTKFENSESVETFTWYVSDGKARLFAYESQ